MNGDCNMRRSRKISPEERGIEQSITIIISFHNTFITKVDRAYRCTCFYMEADKVVTSKLDVSEIPTTDLIDTAKMPLCTYSVRRGSVNGAIVNYATVGEPLFHVWQCESDMFSMLVHSCFVDSDGGNDKKPLLDEHGCSIDTTIIPDLSYNQAANLAYTEVNAFKFADKVTTYFQCAVSTCMISEGMCNGKTL
uniref:ZP domain-containing protein n=1 Tax=Panagrolaimus davidi TaxID=227884 RepID=A0A914PIA9_9BILA